MPGGGDDAALLAEEGDEFLEALGGVEGEEEFAVLQDGVLGGGVDGGGELVVEVLQDARGEGVELGVECVELLEELAAAGFFFAVSPGGLQAGADFIDDVFTGGDPFGDVGFERGEGIDGQLGVVLDVVAAVAAGGDIFGVDGLAQGEEPGGGDAGVTGDSVEEFEEEAVGDLVVEGAADAVEEEVGEEEAREEGQRECPRANDE